MKIWELTVVDFDHPDWKASSSIGKAIARAKNEQDARTLATKQFGIAALKNENTLINPWRNPDLVECKLLDSSSYEHHGKSEILVFQGR